MANRDLVAGLRNAVERGYSLERAKQSFISAGYPREEVEEASRSIYSGSVLEAGRQQMPRLAAAVQPSRPEPMKLETQGSVAKESFINKIRDNLKIVLLIATLAVLIVLLILTFILRESIIGWFA